MTQHPLPFLGLGPLMDATVRSTALIALAALAVFALRRAPAAVRHLVWTLALGGCLTMPLAMRVLPDWSLPALPAWSVRLQQIAPPPAGPSPGREVRPAPVPASAPVSVRQTPPAPPVAQPRFDLARAAGLLPLAWIAGALVLLARHLLGWIRLSNLTRHAAPMDDEGWRKALARHAASLGLRRVPRLRLSPRVVVPIVCGARQPTIVLPVAAVTWPAERRDAVLLHELAHVRRLDLITARVTQLVAALYWFNPIVWLAGRAQQAEAERACDDRVLDAGSRASSYAEALLEFARTLHGGERLDASALAMARRSQLEGRLLAILDPRLRRGGAGPVTVAIAVLVTAGTIAAIAAGRPQPGAREPEARLAAAVDEPTVASAKAPVDAAAKPTRAGRPEPPERAQNGLIATAARMLADGASHVHIDSDSDSKTGTWNFRNDRGTRLISKGTVRYSDALDDVESISSGGWVEGEDKRDSGWHRATFKSDGHGIERRYWVGGQERPWDDGARAWFANFLIEIDRGGGSFVEQRFPRLLQDGGPDRVLREVSEMTSDYARGVYLRRLLASTRLDEATMRRIVGEAGREIRSDYELSNTLIEAARHHALDDAATRTAYLEAATGLQSDYEHGRALMVLVERDDLSAPLVDGAIASASHMQSDYERARVMVALAEKGHVKGPLQRGYLRATQALSSDYERGRVLRALLDGSRLENGNIEDLLDATAAFSSDNERANVLVDLAGSVRMNATQRAAYVKAARAMSSDYERQRALGVLPLVR